MTEEQPMTCCANGDKYIIVSVLCQINLRTLYQSVR